MAALRLKIQYNKNEGLIISPSELRESYLFGIPVCTNDGRKISPATIKQQIQAAQKRIENLFSIRLARQVICESKDFVRTEWSVWGYVKSTFPIANPIKLLGYIGETKQVTYPKEWLSVKHTESVAVWRNLYMVPNSASVHGATMSSHSLIYNGVTPHIGYYGKNYIPNYWRLKYITGWKAVEIPDDLMDIVNKLAAINVLAILGSYIYGVFSSISVSLDGVSQNFPLRNGKYGLFSDRIEMYREDINNLIETMKYLYCGITMDVV